LEALFSYVSFSIDLYIPAFSSEPWPCVAHSMPSKRQKLKNKINKNKNTKNDVGHFYSEDLDV